MQMFVVISNGVPQQGLYLKPTKFASEHGTIFSKNITIQDGRETKFGANTIKDLLRTFLSNLSNFKQLPWLCAFTNKYVILYKTNVH